MKIIKSCLTLIILLVCCTTAFAGGPEGAPYYNFDGFYGSAGVGLTFGDFKLMSQSEELGNFNIDYGRATTEATTTELDLGYGREYKRLYMGVYIEGQYYNLHRDAIDFLDFPTVANPPPYNNNTYKVALEGSFGVGIKPGVLLSPHTLLFANLGIAWAHATFTTIWDSWNQAGGVVYAPYANSRNQWVTGARVGVGIENKFDEHWSLVLKYLYSYYGHLGKSTAIATNTLRQFTSYVFSTNTILGGVDYYFNPTVGGHAYDEPIDGRYFNWFFLGVYGGMDWLYSSQNFIELIDNNGSNYIFQNSLEAGFNEEVHHS